MTTSVTSIRLDKRLADRAAKVLGVKTRTEAARKALEEIVALDNFKKLMLKNGGEFKLEGAGE